MISTLAFATLVLMEMANVAEIQMSVKRTCMIVTKMQSAPTLTEVSPVPAHLVIREMEKLVPRKQLILVRQH